MVKIVTVTSRSLLCSLNNFCQLIPFNKDKRNAKTVVSNSSAEDPPPPQVEISDYEFGQASDDQEEAKRHEPDADQTPPPAPNPVHANPNPINPYAPEGWIHRPQEDNPNPPPQGDQRSGVARPDQQRILSETLTAITSLQRCVASLAAAVQGSPNPRQERTNTDPVPHYNPQQSHTSNQPVPTLADFVANSTAPQKRHVSLNV